MSNRNWVCFNCRITNRKPSSFEGIAACSECGGSCKNIGYKIPVPPKNKPKLWIKLQQQLASEDRDVARTGFEHSVKRRHELERELVKLKSLPQNEGRKSLIKQLEAQLVYA